MKRLLLLLCVLTAVVGCKPDFRRRTARYASVGELRERRAAVLDTVDGAPRWGYVDAEGRLVIPCRYAAAAPFSEGRAAVQIPGERWGYIDTTGLMVIAPEYAVASPFGDSLAWVELPGGLRGRIDREGREVIACLYSEIGEPGLRGWRAAVRNGRRGYLSESGGEVVPCLYDSIGPVGERGWMAALRNARRGYLDSLGREVIPCRYDTIAPFTGGYALAARTVDQGLRWGLVDSLGGEPVACRYEELDAPSDGRLLFRSGGGRYGYLDLTGRVVLPARYAVARSFNERVAVVSYDGVHFGAIDRLGRELSSFCYESLGNFHDGLAPFNENTRGAIFPAMTHYCGYVDTEGREVISPRFDDAREFSERRAAVMRLGMVRDDFYKPRWGYIAPTGELMVPYRYDEVWPFSCGLGRVYLEGRGYGYVDRSGSEVLPCQFEQAEDFVDFTARVRLDGRDFRIDTKGQEVTAAGH